MLEMRGVEQGGRPSEGARDLRLFQDHHQHLYSAGHFMDVTSSAGAGGRGGSTCTAAANANNANALPRKKMMNGTAEGKRIEYRRSLSQQGRKKVFSGGGSFCLSFQGLFLLVCLTASLLLLPLILPPLPPPPFLLLLLLPICILGLLMVLAFMPSNAARDAATTYAYL